MKRVITTMLFVALMIGTLCAQTVEIRHAIQRPSEYQKSRATAGLLASLCQGACYDQKTTSQRMESKESREGQGEGQKKKAQANMDASYDREGVSDKTSGSEQLLRAVRTDIHDRESSGSRPLSSNELEQRTAAQHVQYCYRFTEGQSRAVCSSSELLDKVEDFARAIARTEGFYMKRTIPNRYHNPGDLKADCGYRFPGQVGVGKGKHAIFRNDAAGWAALDHQILMMVEGRSKHYTLDMTINQMARFYAQSWRVWAKNMQKHLAFDRSKRLREYFLADVPAPTVVYKFDLRRVHIE